MIDRNRRYTTKKAWIFDELRTAILTGRLEPGQRLLENELAEQYDVSATPIREAMRQLEAEGLVLSEPHRGVRVVEANVQETRERYLIRMSLEKLALQLAMENYDQIPVSDLQQMLVEMHELLDQQRWSELRVLHFDFHNALYKSANAPMLRRLLNQLWTYLPWDRIETIPGRAPQVLEEHRKIVQAIAERDKEGAVSAVEEHIGNAMQAFLSYKN
jgi:DNA-binding GntR family transcriptional regulator